LALDLLLSRFQWLVPLAESLGRDLSFDVEVIDLIHLTLQLL
jgi:hypothetical protein